MGIVRALVSAAAASHRRGLKEETLRKSDMLAAGWLTGVVFIRFAVNSGFAVKELSSGQRSLGLAMMEFSILHMLVVVFLLVFLLSSLSLGTAGLDRRRLALSPVPFRGLFLAELAGLFINPMNGITLPFAAAALIPLLFLPHPFSAAVALLLAFTAAWLAAWAFSLILTRGRGGRGLAALLRVGFAGVMAGLVIANFDFRWSGQAVTVMIAQLPVLLAAPGGGGLLPRLGQWPPSAWVMGAALAPRAAFWLAPVLSAAAAATLAYLGLWGALRAAVRPTSEGARRTREWPSRPSRIRGVVLAHEVSTSASSGAARFAVLSGAGFALWTLLSRDAAPAIPILGAVIVLASAFGFMANAFGREGHAFSRYVMLSPDWGEIFVAKNAASLCSALLPLLPLIVVTAVRLSPAAALSLALSAGAVSLLQLLWGNMSSILVPTIAGSPEESAASVRQPVFANQVFPFAAWGLPLVVRAAARVRFGSPGYNIALAGCAAALGAAYVLEIARIRRRFSEDAEKVLERM